MNKIIVLLLLVSGLFVYADHSENQIEDVEMEDVQFGVSDEFFSLSIGLWSNSFSTAGLMFNAELPFFSIDNHSFFGFLDYGTEIKDTLAGVPVPMLLTTGLGYRYTLPFGLNFSATAGVGRYSSEGFSFGMTVNNQEVDFFHSGVGEFAYAASLGVGYDFSKKFNLPFETFARVQGFGSFEGIGHEMMNFAGSVGFKIKL